MKREPMKRSAEHAMDDNTMEMEFQDIMEFVARESTGDERKEMTMIQFDDEQKLPARIKVIGVGGCGGNAVSTMVEAGIQGVEFVAANTDRQALDGTGSPNKFQMGSKLTKGRGAGANPEVGRNAALEDADRIKTLLEGTEMVFITAGMGGGTGTGAAPVIAKLAREVGALAVGVVTKPFSFEGDRRMRFADEGIAELKKYVDALIVIPNDRLINLSEKNTPIQEAFKLSDDVLVQAVKGISDVVLVRGRVNVDFADVKTVMANRGRAVMGMGIAKGPGRAVEAAHKAISSPLIEDGSIKGTRAALINITGGSDMGMAEVYEAMGVIKAEADPDANIIFGMVVNAEMAEELKVTVIATGFDERGIRDRVKHPANLKELMQKEQRNVVDRPAVFKRGREAAASNATGDLFGSKTNLDLPAYLRRAAD